MERVRCRFPAAIAAGILICMGCIANLKVGGIPGAVIFSAGLWFVVNFDAELFTGRVAQDRYDPWQKLLMLAGNLLGAAVCGLLAGVCMPEIGETARTMMAGYAAQSPLTVLWRAVMCGICMYLATTRTGEESRLPFVVYGVVLFILSGYAHSIALAGYAAVAQRVAWWVIPLSATGNAAGSYLMRFLLTARKTAKGQ